MNKIGWCTETWNPVIGCTKISDGCKNCYAERMARRLANIYKTSYYESVIVNQGHPANVGKWNKKTYFNYRHINKPFHWKKPRMIFVCSMGDLFHESVPFEWIDKVFDMIFNCPQHIFQILTKRPERIIKYENWKWDKIKMYAYSELNKIYPNNLWLGITAENQAMADKRIPILLQIPAKVRFVSCEPLLGEILIPDLQKINQVIAGCETGHNARLMKKEWIESLYQQCKDVGVPFFDKRNELNLNLKQFPI